MGHRRSKAVVRPPSPRILVAEIGNSYLFIPAEEVLAHKNHSYSVTVGRHLRFSFICHNGKGGQHAFDRTALLHLENAQKPNRA
jgi:hypothetical protein